MKVIVLILMMSISLSVFSKESESFTNEQYTDLISNTSLAYLNAYGTYVSIANKIPKLGYLTSFAFGISIGKNFNTIDEAAGSPVRTRLIDSIEEMGSIFNGQRTSKEIVNQAISTNTVSQSHFSR